MFEKKFSSIEWVKILKIEDTIIRSLVDNRTHFNVYNYTRSLFSFVCACSCIWSNLNVRQKRKKEEEKKFSSTVTVVLVAGTDVRPTVNVNSTDISKTALSTPLNQTRVKAVTATMLLHNNSLKYVQDFSHVHTHHHHHILFKNQSYSQHVRHLILLLIYLVAKKMVNHSPTISYQRILIIMNHHHHR